MATQHGAGGDARKARAPPLSSLACDIDMPEYDDPEEELPYQAPDDIDFSRMWSVFRELPLFDDTYLNMQAMNIAMVDGNSGSE